VFIFHNFLISELWQSSTGTIDEHNDHVLLHLLEWISIWGWGRTEAPIELSARSAGMGVSTSRWGRGL